MAKATANVNLERITGDSREQVKDAVSCEKPLTIILNGRELVTLLATPVNLDYLAVGYLHSEGLLHSRENLKKVTVDDKRGVARVETQNEPEPSADYLTQRLITSGCGGGPSFYRAADVIEPIEFKTEVFLSAAEIFDAMKEFQKRSDVFRDTGGVHSAAVRDTRGKLVFNEDIGRHNALDKAIGKLLLAGRKTDGLGAVLSGRVSLEMVSKSARAGIEVISAVSAPTSLGVEAATRCNITLCAFVRSDRATVFTNPERILQ